MKLLFLLAFVGLSASASLPPAGQLQASAPRQLEYQYDAQIGSGIEEVSSQFSTVRMRFRVRMRTNGEADASSAAGAEKWTVAFTEVSLRQRNNATEQLPKTLLPMAEFRNLEDPQLWAQVERALKQPFAVLLHPCEQKIAKVLFNHAEPFWSVNIKKGFLNMLQVDFIPKDASSAHLEKGQWTKEQDEMTSAAVCKTFYTADKIEYHESDSPVFRVTKAIDYNNCRNPMDGSRGLAAMWNGLRHFDSLWTAGQEGRAELVSVSNLAQYLVEMGADRASPLVRKGWARTVHTLSPGSDSTLGTEKIFSVQKLKLISSRAISTSDVEAPEALTEQPEGLRLIYPQEARNIDREALLNEVARQFRSMWKASGSSASDSQNELDMRALEQIVRILRFHLKSVEDLEALAQRIRAQPDQRRALQALVMDICPQVATHGSIQFLMRIVKALAKTRSESAAAEIAGQAGLTIYHIPAIFAKLSMTSKLQLRTLRVVFDTVKDKDFQAKLMTAERMPIFSATWLSLGAMVNVYYGRQAGVEPYLQPLPDVAAPWEARRVHAASSEQFRREFIAEVTAGLKRTDAGRYLALKVAKNCGLFELYDQLSPLIRSRDARKISERVQAVYATQNMLHRNSLVRVTSEDARSVSQEEKYIRDDSEYRRHFEAVSGRIQADLIACFRNAREDPELRIACYRVLMQCPSVKQTVLNMLVQAVLSEPTQQVYAYCVSHMAQVSGSSLPRYDRVRPTVRSALSMLQRREPMEQVYSRVFHGQLWDELSKLGLTVETDMIVSDKSFVPRWTHIRFEHQAMDKNVPALEISMRTQGLQSLLEKVFGPRGLIYKSGSFAQLLRRAGRSLDASVDSELLNILPRILAEVPNMDLTVALMGYDAIYVKNIRELSRSSEQLKAKTIKKMMSSLGNVLQPFVGQSSISANYEMPTPAGAILDFNCFMTLDFWPKVTLQSQVTDNKARYHVKASLPMVIKGFKRFGSNMHVLNHYHQWLTTVKVLKQSSQEFVIQMDLANPKQPTFSLLLSAPGSNSPIAQFRNAAYSTFTETSFQSGRITITSKNVTVVHRQIQQQKRVDFSPLLSSLLVPFGYKLQVQGKHHSTANLYEAPLSLLSGPAEFTAFIKPTTEEETGRSVFISSKLEVIYPEEEESAAVKPPQVRLQVNNVRIQSDSSETIKQRLVSAIIEPREWTASQRTFRCNLRYHLGLPSSYRVSGYQLTINGQIELPEDLPMSLRSLPLRSNEWFNDRRLRMELSISDEESQVANVEVQFSTNPELKKLLVDSGLSESQMKNMFPRIAVCLNESRKSVQEEPLSANPLFTPSCIRQFKKFNKLSQIEIEIARPAGWFMNPQASPLFSAAVQKIEDYLRPYLAFSEARRTLDANKIRIVSRPSPVDIRVQHLNVTCANRKNVWRSIQLPSVPFSWAGVVPIATSAMDYAKGGRTKCSLLHSHVKTFDDVAYSIPKSLFSQIADNQCPMLLAKDCSNAKEFQVLAHIKNGKKYITLHLNTESSRPFVVEVSKPINSDQVKSTVKVNEVEVEHSEEPRQEVEIYKRTVSTEKGPVTVVISKYNYAGTVMYKVSSEQHQVSLLVGGKKLRTVEIRVSPYYRNRICGLCGDYNGEKFREFKGPNYHRVAATDKKMVEQYVLPVSDSCRMDQSDSSQAQSSESSQANSRSYWSSDMPRRRSSCHIVAGKKVKTFKHAELELMSPALKQIIRDTECAAKLAVAKIGDERVRVYLQSSRSEVLVKIGRDYEQRLSLSSPSSSEQTDSAAPSGVTAHLEKQASQAALRLTKGDSRVTIKVTRDQQIVIKASQIDESEEAVCEMSHPAQMSQVDSSSGSPFESLKKFTNAEESPVCREQLKRRINQCRVSPVRVQPFHLPGESDWWQPRYQDAQLLDRLAQTQAPLILSADQIAQEAAVYSVQLVLARPAGSGDSERLTRHILLKKDQATLAKISVPAELGSSSEARVSVTYSRDGAEHSTDDSPTDQDIDSNFRLSVSAQRISLAHKSRLYQLDIEPQAGQPEVTIVRPYAHPSYAKVGLCQANQLIEVREHHANPRAVLIGAVRATLRAPAGPSAMLSEAEIARASRLLSSIERDEDNSSSRGLEEFEF